MGDIQEKNQQNLETGVVAREGRDDSQVPGLGNWVDDCAIF